MPIKQTVPTNSGDYLQFGNATTPVAAQIGGYEDSTGNGHLELYTTAGGVVTERVRVDSAGNVGIGTTVPSSYAPLTVRKYITSGSQQVAASFSDAVNATLSIGFTSGYANFVCDNGQAFYTSNAERMRIDSSGNVLVGTTVQPYSASKGFAALAAGSAQVAANSGNEALGVYVNGIAKYLNFFYNASTSGSASGGTNTGSITTNGTTTSFNTTSDYRLKENVQPMTGALETVAKLNPVTYIWKSTGEEGQGFIAHELQSVVPDCVTGEKDAVDDEGNPQYQGIDTSFLVATLTAAIKEQQELIKQLQADVAALKGTV